MLLPDDRLLEQLLVFVIAVMVTVVFPVLVKAPAGTVKLPLPGAPAVKDDSAVRPVAVLAPLKS